MFSRLKISVFLAIVFLIIALGPLALQSYQSSSITKNALSISVGQRFEHLARTTMAEIDQMLYQRKQDLEKWATAPEMQDAEFDDANQRLSKLLRKWKETYGIYSAVYFVKDGGRVVAASSPDVIGRSVINEVWYKTATRPNTYSHALVTREGIQSSAQVGPLEYDSLSGGYGVNFSIPIYSEAKNRRLGMLVTRLNWSELAQMVSRVAVSPEGQNRDSYALLVDHKGNVITGPGFLLTDSKNNEEILFSKNLISLGSEVAQKAIKGGSGFAMEPGWDGDRYVIGYAGSRGHLDFTGLGWSLLVVERAAKTFAPAIAVEQKGLELSIAALLFAAIVTILFSRGIAAQVTKLKTTLSALGKGYFAERTTLTSKSEFGMLGSALNQAAEHIENHIRQERSKREAAEAANRAKGEFLSDIGNEFRNPLTSVIEMSEALLETNLTEDQKAFTRSMRKSACQLLALTNDIRDISRIETGTGSVEKSSFDLCNLIEEVAELLAATGQHRGVEVIVYYDENAPHHFLGDPVRMHQIITNLAAHALRAAQGEQLLISVHADSVTETDAQLRIVVEDSGASLDLQSIGYLFTNESTTVDQTKTAVEDTSGELATSKRLIELMGGKLGTLITEQGSFFWLSLSFARSESSGEEPISVNLSGKTAVVATENKILGKVMLAYLQKTGASVTLTPPESLEQTLRNVTTNSLILVTTSSMLEEQKQLEIIGKLQNNKDTRFLVLSSLSDSSSGKGKIALKDISEITRPVRRQELLQALAKFKR